MGGDSNILSKIASGVGQAVFPSVPIPERPVMDNGKPVLNADGTPKMQSVAPEGTTSWVDRGMPLLGALGAAASGGNPLSGYLQGRGYQQEIARPYQQAYITQQVASQKREQEVAQLQKSYESEQDPQTKAAIHAAIVARGANLPSGPFISALKTQQQRTPTRTVESEAWGTTLEQGLTPGTAEFQKAYGRNLRDIGAQALKAKTDAQVGAAGASERVRISAEKQAKDAAQQEENDKIKAYRDTLPPESDEYRRLSRLLAVGKDAAKYAEGPTAPKPPPDKAVGKPAAYIRPSTPVTDPKTKQIVDVHGGEKMSPAMKESEKSKQGPLVALEAADIKALDTIKAQQDNARHILTLIPKIKKDLASGESLPGENWFTTRRRIAAVYSRQPAAIAYELENNPAFQDYKIARGKLDLTSLRNDLGPSNRINKIELERMLGRTVAAGEDLDTGALRTREYLDQLRWREVEIGTPRPGDPGYHEPVDPAHEALFGQD